MNVKKFLLFIAAIFMAAVSCLAFGYRGGNGWTDEECDEAFNALWWQFAHEASDEYSFTVPDFWSGAHGNPVFRGRSVDPDFLLDGLDFNCRHLYSVSYTEAGTEVSMLESRVHQPQQMPELSSININWGILLIPILLVALLITIPLRSRMRSSSFA